MNPSVQISVKVPLADYQQLDKICLRRNKRLSTVVRGLIADYIDNDDLAELDFENEELEISD